MLGQNKQFFVIFKQTQLSLLNILLEKRSNNSVKLSSFIWKANA